MRPRPKRRGVVAGAAITLALSLLGATAVAEAATLTGENLSGAAEITGTSCDRSGTTTFEFSASGAAGPPYAGTFTESGTISIGPQTDVNVLPTFGTGVITHFHSEFEIVSAAGTVTGSKTLSPDAPTVSQATPLFFGQCFLPSGPGEVPPGGDLDAASVVAHVPFLDYTAQIDDAVLGAQTDQGSASATVGRPGPAGTFGFFNETFTSEPSLPTTKDECKKDGQFALSELFKNRGDCVSFVATDGRNEPDPRTNP